MKKSALALLFIFFVFKGYSQVRRDTMIHIVKDSVIHVRDTSWKIGGGLALTFNQTALMNWAPGGSDAIALNALLAPYANYKKGKVEWNNSLVLAYGVVRNADPNSSRKDTTKWIKSDDRIELTSKVGYGISKLWFLSAILNFKTQFASGFSDPLTQRHQTSDFLNPSRTIFGLGFDYKPKPYLFVFLSPISVNITGITRQSSNTGDAYWKVNSIDSGKFVFYQLGAYANIAFKKDIMKNVNYQSVLTLFSNYLNNPQNVAVNWQNYVLLKVNKVISASFTFQLINDNTIKVPLIQKDNLAPATGIRTQLKETFGLGFAYKLGKQ